MFNMATP